MTNSLIKGTIFYFLKYYFLMIPTLLLINISLVSKIRLVLSFGFLVILFIYNKYPWKNGMHIFVIAFLSLSLLFMIRNAISYAYVGNLIIFLQMYWIFSTSSISVYSKIKLLRFLLIGFAFASLIGITYMLSTGIVIKGGAYTENKWAISNINIPVILGIVLIYIYATKIRNKSKIYSFPNLVILLVIFGFIVFLDKRMPILSVVISIVTINLFGNNNRILVPLSFIVLIYPLYSIPLYDLITPILNSDFLSILFERNEDLVDVSKNGRLIRLYAAFEFLTNIEFINLFYYPTEIRLNMSDSHNHFHNLLLQLYYEKGFISVIAVTVFVIFSYKEKIHKQNEFEVVTFILKTTILFLLIIGTNESLLMSKSFVEFCTITVILINYGITKDIVKIQNLRVRS